MVGCWFRLLGGALYERDVANRLLGPDLLVDRETVRLYLTI